MNNFNISLLMVTLIAMTGCSSMDSQEMGSSVRMMVNEQIENPNAAAEMKQYRGLDGQLGEQVIKTYRQDVSKPEGVSKEIRINVGS